MGLFSKRKKKWFSTKTEDTGWHKNMRPDKRRALMLKAHGGSYYSAGQAMLGLANVTEDSETKEAAEADMHYFFDKYRETGK